MSALPDTEMSTHLLQLAGGGRVTQVLYVTAKLGLADLLLDGPKAVKELACATKTHPPSLYRLLRAAAGLGVVEEDGEGCFTLTALGQCLRSDLQGSLRPMLLLYGEPFWWRVMGDLLESVRTGEASIPRLYGCDLWTYLERHPEDAAVFNDAMTSQSERHVPGILEAYDFSGITTLVDVGAGHGALLCAILQTYPDMHGILFDRSDVLEGARCRLDASGVGARAALVPGDMFVRVPEGIDVYLAKLILHDWDDFHALKILTNIRSAMPPSGRLLLIEHVVESGNSPQFAKFLDLSMLTQLGGRERTAAEWEALLFSTELCVTRIIPTKAGVSVLEAVRR